MIVHLVTPDMFWLNDFTPSKPGAGLSNTKGPGQLILENAVDHKKVCCLHPGKYAQIHQEDEPRITIDTDQTVGKIAL